MEADLDLDVLDRPFDFDRDSLMAEYEMLEIARNGMVSLFEANKKESLRLYGRDLMKRITEHNRLTRRSIEVWMCSLGVAIVPDRRDDVRQIWSYLTNSRDKLDEAIQQIEKLDDEVALASPLGDSFLPHMSEGEWRELCDDMPSYFAKA